MTRFLILIFFIAFYSCSENNSNTESSNKPLVKTVQKSTDTLKAQEKSTKKQDVDLKRKRFVLEDTLKIDGYSGLMILQNYTENIWTLKNKDNSIYKSFDFGQGESKKYYSELDSIVMDFDLFAYKPDYGLLIFKSNIDNDNFIIRTKNGEPKLVDIDCPNFTFMTWKDFLVKGDYVSIKENYWYKGVEERLRLYKSPNDSSDYKQYDETSDVITITGLSVKDNWLKIERKDVWNDSIKPDYGWIKWHEESKLLIDFWFLM